MKIKRATAEKIIREIDGIILTVLKADKWDLLAQRLSDLLLKKVSAEQKEAINDFIRYISAEKDALTEAEIEIGLSLLQKRLGVRLSEKLREAVEKYTSEAYKHAHSEIDVDLRFSQRDYEAIGWLNENVLYWIGERYDSAVNVKVKQAARRVLDSGLSRKEAIGEFRKEFTNVFRKTDSYWDGLANHIITRSREFGRVSAYEKAGAKYVKIVAVLDGVTSEICRNLHGRIIPVSRLSAQREKLLGAKTPEDAKKKAPWLTPREARTKVAGKKTSKLPSSVGMPPYHFNCRTRTVIASENEVNRNIAERNLTHEDFAERLEAKIRNFDDFSREEIVKLIDTAKHSKWEARKIKGTDKYSAQHHYEKHGADVGAKNMAEYNEKAIELFRNPKRELYVGLQRGKIILVGYGKKRAKKRGTLRWLIFLIKIF